MALNFLSDTNSTSCGWPPICLLNFIANVAVTVHIDINADTCNTNTCSRNESVSEYIEICLKLGLKFKEIYFNVEVLKFFLDFVTHFLRKVELWYVRHNGNITIGF